MAESSTELIPPLIDALQDANDLAGQYIFLGVS